jgi:hypothetical protein
MEINEETLEKIKDTIRTSAGLRDTLFEELDNLRKGKISEKQAQMISRLAANIIDSVRVEMSAYNHPLSREFARLPEHPALDI